MIWSPSQTRSAQNCEMFPCCASLYFQWFVLTSMSLTKFQLTLPRMTDIKFQSSPHGYQLSLYHLLNMISVPYHKFWESLLKSVTCRYIDHFQITFLIHWSLQSVLVTVGFLVYIEIKYYGISWFFLSVLVPVVYSFYCNPIQVLDFYPY